MVQAASAWLLEDANVKKFLLAALFALAGSSALAAGSNVNSLSASPAVVASQLLYCPISNTNDYKCTFTQVDAFINSQFSGDLSVTGPGVATATLTGNHSLTSGFTAGQLLYSDGSKLQAESLNGTGLPAGTTNPAFVTPSLGAATATSINKVALSAPATAATLAFNVDAQTFTFQTGGNIPAWSGALTTGDCVKIASGPAFTISDSGSACGGSLTLTVGSTPTSGGAAGQLMYDTGSVLQEATGITATNTTLAIAGGTITTNASALTLTQTWNNSSTTFDAALKINVTNTASNSASLLADYQVGGTTLTEIREDGSLLFNVSSTLFGLIPQSVLGGGFTLGASNNNYAGVFAVIKSNNTGNPSRGDGFQLAAAAVLSWSTAGGSTNNGDLFLWRDGDGILAQRDGSIKAQATRIYNTWTDASDGEWAAIDWQTASNVLTIGAQSNGSGTLRSVNLVGASFSVNGNLGASKTCTTYPTVVNGIVTSC